MGLKLNATTRDAIQQAHDALLRKYEIIGADLHADPLARWEANEVLAALTLRRTQLNATCRKVGLPLISPLTPPDL